MDHNLVMENIKNRIVEKKIEKPKEVIESDLSNILEILNGING